MGVEVILETTFLIDLEREVRRGMTGPAQVFLEARAEERVCSTFTVAGELASGASLAQRELWDEFLAAFEILPWNPDVSWAYGGLYRYLAANGLLIGTNDLWIAATALAYDLPVVTSNERHFRRVPGLTTLRYAGD